MTAEIAILNTTAVALAADSAVTIGDAGNRKVYNSVNKLFGLSRYQPVGIMIYGNADVLFVPWETIIKFFRAQLGRTTCDTLAEYAGEFRRFMEGPCSQLLFPANAQELAVRQDLGRNARSIKKRIQRATERILREERSISEERVAGIAEEQLRPIVEYWGAADSLEGRTEEDAERVRTQYSEAIDAVHKAVFGEQPLSQQSLTYLRQLAGWLFTKKVRSSDEASGIVLAGFGESEIFPHVLSIRIYGFEGGRLLAEAVDDETTGITHDMRAALIAFAQKEMVQTFMQGLDTDHAAFLGGWLSRFLSKELPAALAEVAQGVAPDVVARIAAGIAGLSDGVVEKFHTDLIERMRSRSIFPVIEMIQHLPKDELALMAESLVNLTSLKRRVSLGAETVGGPVDVAVISKGDGFVWTRRKHYFRPELNPHFMAGYVRDAIHGELDGAEDAERYENPSPSEGKGPNPGRAPAVRTRQTAGPKGSRRRSRRAGH
jgi:hypothetical protein